MQYFSTKKLILPEEVSPDVYKVLLDNEEVKVTEVTFKPGQGDEMHQHGVMSIYGITGGKLQNTSPDGTVREMEVADGFVGHRNTVTTHQMKNIGDTTEKLMALQKQKKDLQKDENEEKRQVTNNNMFVGSTTDLQRMLLNKDNVIDAKVKE